MPITLYGIPNCSSVKKAREWLNTHGVAYTFHDVKQQALTEPHLMAWLQQQPYTKLINRSGLTWRGLSEALKASADDPAGAVALLREKPSVMKRPVLEKDGQMLCIGFSETDYQSLFHAPQSPST